MIEILVLLYLIPGFILAVDTYRRATPEPWPPEIQGFFVMMLFWLPALWIAIVKVAREFK